MTRTRKNKKQREQRLLFGHLKPRQRNDVSPREATAAPSLPLYVALDVRIIINSHAINPLELLLRGSLTLFLGCF